MCLSSPVFVALLLFTCTESNEEVSDHFNNAYAPPAVNFQEIFSNSISMLADDPTLTTGTKEEDFHIQIIPTQFVEFQTQKETTVIPVTTPSPPPPKYILNSSYLKKSNVSQRTTSTSTTSIPSSPVTSTTEKEECHIQVIPIKKDTERQRGVLDLLFPASRVRTFKGVFDTFRRILSHTFRKR